MQFVKYNTDMADERVDEYKVVHNLSEVDGIKISQEKYEEFIVTQVEVLNEKGAKAIEKEIGTYITFELPNIKYIENKDKVISEIKKYICNLIEKDESVLVVGIGNMYVTADALGSKVVNGIQVTRHILKLTKNENFKDEREISAIVPGVMGNTGIETSEIISSVSNIVKPDCIILIDSLMSKSIDRVGTSIQISNTSISPGSGISSINSKVEVNKINKNGNEKKAKVISIGVPMVVDIATITAETINKINNEELDNNLYTMICEILDSKNYIVTPKDIDDLIEITAQIISKSINEAL